MPKPTLEQISQRAYNLAERMNENRPDRITWEDIADLSMLICEMVRQIDAQRLEGAVEVLPETDD